MQLDANTLTFVYFELGVFLLDTVQSVYFSMNLPARMVWWRTMGCGT
jgi:hypothetical protein